MSFRKYDDYERIPFSNDIDGDSSEEANLTFDDINEHREENILDQISSFGIGLFKRTSNAVKNAYNTAKTKAMTHLNINNQQQPTTNQTNQNKSLVFGLKLETSLKAGCIDDIPYVLYDCFKELEQRGINEEGIFRLSGSLLIINELKNEYNNGNRPNLDDKDIHVVSGLFKMFFRELDDHILGDLHYELEDMIQNQSDGKYIRDYIQSLPRSNIIILKRLFRLLNEVNRNSNVTLMNIHNLCIIFTAALKINNRTFEYLMNHGEVFKPKTNPFAK